MPATCRQQAAQNSSCVAMGLPLPPQQQRQQLCSRRGAVSCRAQARVVLYDAYDKQIPYEQAWRWQKGMVDTLSAAAASRQSSGSPSSPDGSSGAGVGSVVLLQHPPVYTLGAGSTEGNLKFDAAAPPYPLYRTERGGEVTYHGPGQLVMYPILDLRQAPFQADLHWYMRQLEEVVIRALDACSGLQGERIPGLTGVWVEGQKVAALGVRATRWVTYHGLALNVVTDLSPFRQIVPCGISDRPVASVAGLLEQQAARQQQQQQQQQQQAPAAGAIAEVWDDPLAASFVPEATRPLVGAALSDLAQESARQAAAEAALVEEYRHGLLDAFQEVFQVDLQPADPAGMAALLGATEGRAAASQAVR